MFSLSSLEAVCEKAFGWRVNQISDDGSIMVTLSERFSLLVKMGVEEGISGLLDIQLIDRSAALDRSDVPDVSDIIATALEEQDLEYAMCEIEFRMIDLL